MKYALIIIVSLITIPALYANEIYKSRDEYGTVTYSDKRPKTDYEIVDKGDYRGKNKPEEETTETQLAPDRSLESIDVITQSAKSEIDTIYKNLYLRNQQIKGKVLVKFSIAPQGDVISCTEDESDMVEAGFNGQICETIQGLNYGPVARTLPVNVKYTYDFQPSS